MHIRNARHAAMAIAVLLSETRATDSNPGVLLDPVSRSSGIYSCLNAGIRSQIPDEAFRANTLVMRCFRELEGLMMASWHISSMAGDKRLISVHGRYRLWAEGLSGIRILTSFS